MPKINTAPYPPESADITFLTAQFPPGLYMRKEEGVFSGNQQTRRDRIILTSKADRHPDPLQPGECLQSTWDGLALKETGKSHSRREALSRGFRPGKSSRVDWGEDAVLMFHLNAPDVTRAECVSTEGSRLCDEICRGHSGSGQKMRPQIMWEELFLSYGQGPTILENTVSAPQLLAMHRWEASKLPVNLEDLSWLFCSTAIIHSCRL